MKRGDRTTDVTLDSDLERYVDEQVRAGLYPSADDVIADALAWHKAGDPSHLSTKELQRLLDEGRAAAERGQFFDSEQVFAELRERSRRRRLAQ